MLLRIGQCTFWGMCVCVYFAENTVAQIKACAAMLISDCPGYCVASGCVTFLAVCSLPLPSMWRGHGRTGWVKVQYNCCAVVRVRGGARLCVVGPCEMPRSVCCRSAVPVKLFGVLLVCFHVGLDLGLEEFYIACIM